MSFLGICTTAAEVADRIPLTATNCNVLTRHAKSVQDGPANMRTLLPKGIELCNSVRADYTGDGLVKVLSEQFDNPNFGHSAMVRALLTGWEIFHPEQYEVDDRITLVVSLKKIDDGKWFAARKEAGKSVGEMLVEVHQNLSLLDGQPYVQRMVEMDNFFTEAGTDCRFRWRFGHEPEPTLWVLRLGLIPDEHVGLAECQSYVVFTNDASEVVGIIKFCPPATTK